jgi:hypothetical protein
VGNITIGVLAGVIVVLLGITIILLTWRASRSGRRRDYEVKYVICAGHGIRTDGRWMAKVFDHLKKKHSDFQDQKEVKFIPLRYGYLLASICVLRLVRAYLIRWMERRLVRYCRLYPKASINYIGHSYGTMLAYEAVRKNDDIRLDRMILVASIVSCHEDFSETIGMGKVNVLHCYCSKNDKVCQYNPFGHSGYWGFLREGERKRRLKPYDNLEVYNNPKDHCGHSGYFKGEDCLEEWADILAPEKLGVSVPDEAWLCPFIAGGPTLLPKCVKKECVFYDGNNEVCLIVKSMKSP